MKKILMFLLALCMVMPMAAQNNKELNKQLKKEYKLKMKTLKKENWALFGSSRSLEVMLLKHYEKLNSDDGNDAYEVVGTASNFISKNVGHQAAVNNACNNYARQAGSTVKGRIVSDMSANGTDGDGEFDHFYAAYESSVEKEIRGEMTESFSLIREVGKTPKGQPLYEMQTYFIISENAACRARLRALDNAKKESEAAQKYADKVSEFVKGAFDPNTGGE